MKPEDKVVSLETAKRLKGASFPQDTEREWKYGGKLSGEQHAALLYRNRPSMLGTADSAWSFYAAPDSQEIGELLPHSVDTKEGSWIITMPNLNGFRYLDYIKYSSNGVGTLLHGYPLLSGKNEAEARAACWLWLKEQGLI